MKWASPIVGKNIEGNSSLYSDILIENMDVTCGFDHKSLTIMIYP